MSDEPNSVEFIVHDYTQSYTDIRWDSEASPFDLPMQMYDDGTNGDELANDHIWTLIVEPIESGTHYWNVYNWDPSDVGFSLIQGDLPEFTIDENG